MICKLLNVNIYKLKKKMMLYVEQLERAKDDGDIKVMSTQSVCDL